jgi:IS1 family transposase
LDEKWSFVQKKEKHCDAANPADARHGDNWDHVAFDPEHRLVLATVPGKRSAEKVEELVADVKKRLEGRVPRLITTDEYPAYKQAILNAYSTRTTPAPTGKPGRPKKARQVPLPQLNYATVHKTRAKGRVISVALEVVFGVVAAVTAALKRSKAGRKINTDFIERHNGTDRNRNSRKVRKTYCFSKDWDTHEAVGYFTMYSYNFCWPVRTLRTRQDNGPWSDRTPAMAAGLAEHVWTLAEWLALPGVRGTT